MSEARELLDGDNAKRLVRTDADARQAFQSRLTKLLCDGKWPMTNWYHDEDFARAYATACHWEDKYIGAQAEVAKLRDAGEAARMEQEKTCAVISQNIDLEAENRRLRADVERLHAELTDASNQLLSEGWCPDDDEPSLAQLCASVAMAEGDARRQRDEAYGREKRLQDELACLRLNYQHALDMVDATQATLAEYSRRLVERDEEIARLREICGTTQDGVLIHDTENFFCPTCASECRVVVDRAYCDECLEESTGYSPKCWLLDSCYSTSEAAKSARKDSN